MCLHNSIKDYELQYATLVKQILVDGEERSVRNGNTLAVFAKTLSFDLMDSFPLLRGRKLYYKPVLGELAAMLRGPTNIGDFEKFGCNYWKEWGDSEGYLNLDYGNAWIDFNGVNQLEQLVEGIKKDPTGRRHLVTGWRPDRLSELSLPCCHLLYQFYVREGMFVDMIWYQRSADLMIGVPSDAILAAALTSIVATETGYAPGKVTMVFGDTHIYANHITAAVQYLNQYNLISSANFPRLTFTIDKQTTLKTFEPSHIVINNYEKGYYTDAIKFNLNV